MKLVTERPSCHLLWFRKVLCAQVLESAGKHQVLIFVHSRKETAKTARFLKEEALREDKLSMFMKVCLPVAPLCSAQVLC